jgi:hypothetical protein
MKKIAIKSGRTVRRRLIFDPRMVLVSSFASDWLLPIELGSLPLGIYLQILRNKEGYGYLLGRKGLNFPVRLKLLRGIGL